MTTIERMQKVREFLRNNESVRDIVAGYLAVVVDKNSPSNLTPVDWAEYMDEADTYLNIILSEAASHC